MVTTIQLKMSIANHAVFHCPLFKQEHNKGDSSDGIIVTMPKQFAEWLDNVEVLQQVMMEPCSYDKQTLDIIQLYNISLATIVQWYLWNVTNNCNK